MAAATLWIWVSDRMPMAFQFRPGKPFINLRTLATAIQGNIQGELSQPIYNPANHS